MFGKERLDRILSKAITHNASKPVEERVKILFLGDQSQITENGGKSDLLGEANNFQKIRKISPVTAVYRTDVSSITEAAETYKDQDVRISEVPAVSNSNQMKVDTMGVIKGSTSISEILGKVKEMYDALKQANNAKEPDIKILVDTPEKAGRYRAALSSANLPVEVVGYLDIQGATVDRIFVDIEKSALPEQLDSKGKEAFYNTVMYTMISRASKLAYVADYQGVMNQIVDPRMIARTQESEEEKKEITKVYSERIAREEYLVNKYVNKQNVNPPVVTPVAEPKQEDNPVPPGSEVTTDPNDEGESQEEAEERRVTTEDFDDATETEGELNIVDEQRSPAPKKRIVGSEGTPDKNDHILQYPNNYINTEKLKENGEILYVNSIDEKILVLAETNEGDFLIVGVVGETEINSLPGELSKVLSESDSYQNTSIPKDRKSPTKRENIQEGGILFRGKTKFVSPLTYWYGKVKRSGRGLVGEIVSLWKEGFKPSGDVTFTMDVYTDKIKASLNKRFGESFSHLVLGEPLLILQIGKQKKPQYIEFKPKRLSNNTPGLQELRGYRDALKEINTMGIGTFGQGNFGSVITYFHNDFEYKDGKVVFKEVAKVTYQKIRDLIDEQYRNNFTEEKFRRMKELMPSIIPAVYGESKKTKDKYQSFTEKEIADNTEQWNKYYGEEGWEAVDNPNEPDKFLVRTFNGEETSYIKGNGLTKGEGAAQKLFNSLAARHQKINGKEVVSKGWIRSILPEKDGKFYSAIREEIEKKYKEVTGEEVKLKGGEKLLSDARSGKYSENLSKLILETAERLTNENLSSNIDLATLDSIVDFTDEHPELYPNVNITVLRNHVKYNEWDKVGEMVDCYFDKVTQTKVVVSLEGTPSPRRTSTEPLPASPFDDNSFGSVEDRLFQTASEASQLTRDELYGEEIQDESLLSLINVNSVKRLMKKLNLC